MATANLLAASVLSLALVGTGVTHADNSTTTSAEKPRGVLQLFGKTLCLTDVPRDTHCDWKLPETEPEQTALTTVTPTGPRNKAPQPKVWHLLGMNFCFGEVGQTEFGAKQSKCHLTLPMATDPEKQTRASL